MTKGRSANSVRNVATGLANKVLLTALAFVTRTLFVRLLGAEYTGVNSLYTNILSVLSLAEMGIGNVLMYYLYGALKERDQKTVYLLVYEFKRLYLAVIVVILTIGFSLIPLLGFIVHSTLSKSEVIGYYILNLINSVSSYFIVYRTMVLLADQKSYISNIVHSIAIIVTYILQIVYLLVVKDYWGYLIIQVSCAIGSNIVLNKIALKHYPYLKKRKHEKNETVVNRGDLVQNIKAAFLFKISDTILDQTDSIIISIMFGTIMVGYYSNYFMLISYLVATAGIIANGLVASIGNLTAEGNNQRSYEVFRAALTAFSVFGIICTTCYASLVQDFIPIWVGAKYVMPFKLVISILAVFFLRMSTNTVWMYRSAMGLFKEVQYVNFFAAILNIFLSILLGKYLGVAGIIVATAVSRLLTSFWYEGRVVFNRFEKKLIEYLLFQLKSFLFCIISVSASLFLCQFIKSGPILVLFFKALVSLAVSMSVIFLAYGKTEELKTIKNKLLFTLKRGQ